MLQEQDSALTGTSTLELGKELNGDIEAEMALLLEARRVHLYSGSSMGAFSLNPKLGYTQCPLRAEVKRNGRRIHPNLERCTFILSRPDWSHR